MREHYEFSRMKGKKNPYIKDLKQPVTIRLDRASVAYFRAMAGELGIPYQNLINLYLRDCTIHHKKLFLKWSASESQGRKRRTKAGSLARTSRC